MTWLRALVGLVRLTPEVLARRVYVWHLQQRLAVSEQQHLRERRRRLRAWRDQ